MEGRREARVLDEEAPRYQHARVCTSIHTHTHMIPGHPFSRVQACATSMCVLCDWQEPQRCRTPVIGTRLQTGHFCRVALLLSRVGRGDSDPQPSQSQQGRYNDSCGGGRVGGANLDSVLPRAGREQKLPEPETAQLPSLVGRSHTLLGRTACLTPPFPSTPLPGLGK